MGGDTGSGGSNPVIDAGLPGGDVAHPSFSMAEREIDLIPFIMSATLLRGQIRCRLSTTYECGYEIRPIVWFTKRIPEVESSLKSLGLDFREVFVRTEDIAKICHAYRGYFGLSPMEHQLRLVENLNGRLPQPHDHEEVEEVLEMIESASESLIPPAPSAERQGSETNE